MRYLLLLLGACVLGLALFVTVGLTLLSLELRRALGATWLSYLTNQSLIGVYAFQRAWRWAWPVAFIVASIITAWALGGAWR